MIKIVEIKNNYCNTKIGCWIVKNPVTNFIKVRGENMINGLTVKDVDFCGSMLKAAQDMNNVIWVGVRWICDGIGLSEGQIKRERKKLKEDLVLSKGGRNLVLPTNGGNQEVLCIMLDYLPIWLAKISITPTMKKENPELVDKLVKYQLKAKDVLAAAFLGKKEMSSVQPSLPRNVVQVQLPEIPDYMEQFAEINRKIDKFYEDMGKLTKIIIQRSEPVSMNAPKQIEIKTDDQAIWKQSMYRKMDSILDGEAFQDKSEIMKYIYKYMNRNYGIVWDQEIKEYIEQNNCSQKPSTIDVVYGNDTYRSIFEAILTDLEGKSVPNRKTTDDVIRPLIEKYNDHSNAGMSTWRRVYQEIDQKYHPCWKNLETRYINRHGIKTLSKKQLIETQPGLRKKFEAVVKDMLSE